MRISIQTLAKLPRSLLSPPLLHLKIPSPSLLVHIISCGTSMRLISCPPSFFGSSKKKNRGDPTSSLGSSSDDQTITPKSVLSPKPRRQSRNRSGSGCNKEKYCYSSSSEAAGVGAEGEKKQVTRRELEVVLRRLRPEPPTEEELAAMLEEADRRGDGHFSVEEIAALGLEAGGPASPELRETFSVFDGDGDGKISAEELLGLFSTLGDEGCRLEDCRRMIGVVDTDGDGFVCFDDFARMMRGQR